MKSAQLLELFRASDLHGRATLTWSHGSFLLSRQYYGQKVCLYAMPGFFSEVFIVEATTEIDKIEPLTTSIQLQKYLHLIELTDLF